jgi:uncharacterized GH25 family protein
MRRMSRTGRIASGVLAAALVVGAVFLARRDGDGRREDDRATAGDDGTASSTRIAPPRLGAKAQQAGDADAAVAATEPTGTRRLTGVVRAADGHALAGAIVRAEPAAVLPFAPDARRAVETTADAGGAFDLQRLADGDWSLFVSAEGALRTFAATVRVPARERIDLVLPRGGEIDGTVIDESTRAGIPGARVRVRDGRRWIVEARTSADGRFRAAFHGDADEFRIDATGYATTPAESSSMEIDADVLGRHEVLLVASRGRTLTGTVLGPDGPVAGAHVLLDLDCRDPETRREVVADAAGRFAFEHLEEGWYWLRAETDGLVQDRIEDPAAADASDVFGDYVNTAEEGWTHDLRMGKRSTRRPCTIRGRVVVVGDGGDDKPIAGASVRTRQGPLSVATTSDTDGAFALVTTVADATDAEVGLGVELQGYFHYGDRALVRATDDAVDMRLELVQVQMRRLRGRVRDAGGAPVAGAHVVVVGYRVEARCVFGGPTGPSLGAKTTSGDDGTFDVAFDPDDRAAVAVDAPDFAPWRGTFTAAQVEAPLEITLSPPRTVAGRVVRAGTEVGVGDADVAILRDVPLDDRADPVEESRFAARVVATTAADGSFRVDGLAATDGLRFHGAGLLDVGLSAERLAGDALRVEMQPALELAGRARFADGRPCADVAVAAYLDGTDGDIESDAFGATVGAAADGSFVVGPLPAGNWRLEFRGGSPQVVRRMVGPLAAGTRDLAVELVPGRTIRGRVLRPGGEPEQFVTVVAWPDGEGETRGEGEVDHAGAFAVGGLGDGAFVVSVEARGCLPWKRSGIRPGGEPLEIRLDAGMAVAGRVLGPDGRRFWPCRLRLEPVEEREGVDAREGATDEDGRFRVTGLVAGKWRIVEGQTGDCPRFPGEIVVEAGAEDVVVLCVPPPAREEEPAEAPK